ncbi:MAG: putative baseplate assembly protein [Acidobacteriaceae bacterium]|nr:putative baseplate assembly protein [Acidobacteriaceae bacterium]
MPLPQVQLDNRSYSDLVTELRRRIPAYTPEWTDFNESDPGIALIELFSWLADILIYRINQIPDRAYVKFLEMIGITLDLPSAAQAYLTFTLTSKDLPSPVNVPGGTTVGLSNASASPVIFETTEDLWVTGAALAAVQTYDGARYSVVNNFNPTDGSSYYPFSQTPQADAALYMGFDRPFPAAAGVQYPLIFLVQTPSVNGAAQGGTAAQSSSQPIVGVLEYSTASGWAPFAGVQDTTNSLTNSGAILFQGASDWVATQYGAFRKSSDPSYYWMRYRIGQLVGPGYQSPPQLTNLLVNTVQALNAVTEEGEVIGGSNGLPNQSFIISHAPVLPNDPGVTGIVEVDEGDGNGPTLWAEVPDFSGSGPNDKVYTLDHSSGTITFGDGVHGKIPRWLSSDGSNLESSDTPNIQVTSYKWGGGSAGNAGSNSITSLIDTVPFIASVTNILPAQLGADEETVADAQERAPEAIRTLSRAVTPEDFIALARRTPGARIQRATAIPLQRPQTQVVRAPDGTVITPPLAPGVITVIVVPDGPNPARPVANDQTLAAVAAYLDGYRLITTELYVTTPVYRLVEVHATVTATPGALSTDVQAAVQNALLAFYNPLTGGQQSAGLQGSGWDFGGTIYVSDAYQQILQIDSVDRVEGPIRIYVDNQLQAQDQDIPLQPFELVYSTNHVISVSYS